MKPGEDWTMLRTISSAMESGSINLAAIGRQFGLDLEAMAAPVIDQWIEAGLLFGRGEWLLQTVAGQFWHVTLAQLLINFIREQRAGVLPKHEHARFMPFDMAAEQRSELLVTVDAKGGLFLGDAPATIESIAKALDKQPDRLLNIFMDERAPFASFMAVLDLAKLKRSGRFVISTRAEGEAANP